ncbi:MAG: hypothetical protein ACLP50_21350 [Solirubrobacteraceae bacterium]
MTAASTSLRHFYDVHGVGVEVHAPDAAVMEAMELRLRDFRCRPSRTGAIRFEFVTDDPEPPSGAGRPVYDTPDGSLHYFPVADALYGDLGGVTLRCEPGRGVARLHSREFSGRRLYLATHPLATVSLMVLLERRGLFSLHAGCLAAPGGHGVLLAGPSGAGKSTLALTLARRGMRFLSDDVVFLERGAELVRALGFADTIGITQNTAGRFIELRARLAEPATDGFPKRLGRIEDLFGAASGRACEPRALVFPEVVPDRPSRIAPLDPGSALLRLVPDVLLTEPAATQTHLEAIAALLGQARCYTLASGSDLERAAELVQALV